MVNLNQKERIVDKSKWIVRIAVVLSFIGVTELFFSGNIPAQINQAPLSPVVPLPDPLPDPLPPDPPFPDPPFPDPDLPWIDPWLDPWFPWTDPWLDPWFDPGDPDPIFYDPNLGLGGTIDNPILPTDITFDNSIPIFNIRVNVTIDLVGSIQWCDPVIAVGYNYFIDHGPSVRDIELPEGIGDNKYNLWIFNPALNDFTDSGVELIGGEKYKFEKPVRKFSIRGIEIEAGLDPENQRAFPTGLAFNRTGKVKMRMVPITVDTDKQ
jgi:hypothetical protein